MMCNINNNQEIYDNDNNNNDNYNNNDNNKGVMYSYVRYRYPLFVGSHSKGVDGAAFSS